VHCHVSLTQGCWVDVEPKSCRFTWRKEDASKSNEAPWSIGLISLAKELHEGTTVSIPCIFHRHIDLDACVR
jgi:hypothetical protein